MAYIPPLNGGRLNASIAGNTSGTASFLSSGTMVLAGGNNITLSQSGNTISFNASAGGGAGSIGIGASSGNISGNTGVISGSNVQYVFSGGNNITLTQSISNSSGTLGISGPSFSNANNVSLGISNNGVVTASASFSQSLQTSNVIQAAAAGGSTMTNGTLSFANSNGIGFGLNNGILTASAAPNGIQAVSAGGMSTGGGTVQFANSNGIAFGLNGSVMTASYTVPSAAQASINISASNTSANLASVIFANANGVNFGLNGSVITASATPDGIQNVAAGGVTQTGGNLTFSNANNINFGLNGSVMTASYAGGAGGGVALSASNSSYGSGTVNFNAVSGALTISGNSNSLNFAVPATSSLVGNNITLSTNGSTISINGPVFSNSNGVSFGTNGSVVTASVSAAGGVSAAALSRWQAPDTAIGPISAPVNNSLSFHRIYIPSELYMSAGIIGGSVSFASSSVSSTVSVNMSLYMGIYTMNNSTLSLLSNASYNNSFTYNYSSTSGLSAYTGMRRMSVGFSSTTNTGSPLPPGEYWIGMMYNGTANLAGAAPNWTLYGDVGFAEAMATAASLSTNYTSVQLAFAPLGSNASVSRELVPLQGIYSTTVSALPSSVAGSQINNANITQVMRAANYIALINGIY